MTTPTKIQYTPYNVSAPTKSGVMKPDAQGRYTVVFGGLNTFNASGIWFTLEESDKMFSSSSAFQKNIAEGTISSENGHPVRPPGMEDEAWVERFLGLEEARFTNTVEKVWLDPDYAKKFNDKRIDKNTVVIMGLVKPAGELKHIIEDIIKNPNQNLCFSIRCITDTYTRNSVKVKVIRGVITFDLVYSGGLIFSKKSFHPSTESISEMGRKDALRILSEMDEERLSHLTSENVGAKAIIADLSKEIVLQETKPIYLGL